MPDESKRHPNPSKALRITLTTPIKLRRITNGERVVWQAGPDEIDVELVDGDDRAHARFCELHKIFDDAGLQLRKRRKFRIPSSPKTAGAKSEYMTSARSTARQMGDSRNCSEASRYPRREK